MCSRAVRSIELDVSAVVKRSPTHIQDKAIVERRANSEGTAAHIHYTPALCGTSVSVPLLNIGSRHPLCIKDVEVPLTSAILNRNCSIRVRANIPLLRTGTVGRPQLNIRAVGTRAVGNIQRLGTIVGGNDGIGASIYQRARPQLKALGSRSIGSIGANVSPVARRTRLCTEHVASRNVSKNNAPLTNLRRPKLRFIIAQSANAHVAIAILGEDLARNETFDGIGVIAVRHLSDFPFLSDRFVGRIQLHIGAVANRATRNIENSGSRRRARNGKEALGQKRGQFSQSQLLR